MPNINKVVYGGNTLIDLTDSTLSSADQLMQGVTAYDRSGTKITGTATGGGTAAISIVDTPDSHGGDVRTITALDISDTTATASDVINNKWFYTADGTRTQGTGSGGVAPTGNINITQAGVTDVTNYATATVPSASPYTNFYNNHFYTENNQRMWSITSVCEVDVGEGDVEGWLPNGFRQTGDYAVSAVPANTTITPSTQAQTVGGANYMMESSVTVAAMPSGTAGTPTATKGTISNHSVSVTPSVTNTTGYITGSTKTGTAVTVSASELVSGSETKTANGTYDVTNLASLVVAVPIVTYYTGSSVPTSSLGSNGDIYLQTGS